MRIGILAKRAGVSASSIRFYEARGLLPLSERHLNGYRDYDERTLQIILFINRARGLGFSLAEIAAHICSPQDETRKSRLLSSMEAKLGEMDGLG
jgi:DNA-binding transcriptional MerR regulator